MPYHANSLSLEVVTVLLPYFGHIVDCFQLKTPSLFDKQRWQTKNTHTEGQPLQNPTLLSASKTVGIKNVNAESIVARKATYQTVNTAGLNKILCRYTSSKPLLLSKINFLKLWQSFAVRQSIHQPVPCVSQVLYFLPMKLSVATEIHLYLYPVRS